MDTTQFTAKDGHIYEIQVDDFGEEIKVFRGDDLVGSITLRCDEADPPEQSDESFHIMNLSLEKCQGLGIGEAALRFHIAMHGGTITAAADDGMQPDDGSHLTGAGPGFVAAMRKKGLVAHDGSDCFGPDDED